MMRRHSILLASTLATVLALVIVAPSSAALAASHGHHKAKKHHAAAKSKGKKSSTSTGTSAGTPGADASGSFCQLYKTEITQSTSQGAALEKDIENNDWSAAQRILETDFQSAGRAGAEMLAAASSAPSNVKAAAQYSVRTVLPQEEAAVKNSTSVAQYEQASEQIFENTTTVGYANVLKQYETTECGAVTSTT